MTTKTCTQCKQIKPISDFGNHIKCKNGTPTCKVCINANWRNYYSNNTSRVKETNIRIRHRNRQFIQSYLSNHPCIDCGEARWEVLEFDHVRGDKKNCISTMSQGRSLNAIKNEIDKCEVRCANCHRLKTIKQLGWYRGNTEI